MRIGVITFAGARSCDPPSNHHRLSVVLSGSTACASSRIGDGRWARSRHVPGAVSFVPAAFRQQSYIGTGRIDRLELLIPASTAAGFEGAGDIA